MKKYEFYSKYAFRCDSILYRCTNEGYFRVRENVTRIGDDRFVKIKQETYFKKMERAQKMESRYDEDFAEEVYDSIPQETIEMLLQIGRDAAEKQQDESTLYKYYEELGPDQIRFVEFGYHYPEFRLEEPRWFYRIGEPAENTYTGGYTNSWNHATDFPEEGVSVVTSTWLNSTKSVLFGATDDRIAARGIYKIKGYALPAHGGDGEPLIYPVAWAQKTKIRTRAGLARAVKKIGM